MTTRFASGREVLVGRGIPQPIPIALAPAAYAGSFAYGEDGLMYYCDGVEWVTTEGARPQRVVSSAYTAVLADAGRLINISAGGVTIPAGVFGAGQKFSVLNNSAVTQDVVPAVGVTLYLSGTAATGPQTLGPWGKVEIECISANTFVMSGTGSVTPNPEGVTLVAPNFFSAPLTLQRAQLTGVRSTAVNGSDDGLLLYGADVPRFNGSAQRLLLGGQGTNAIRNPNQEGAVAGSPGTAPTSYVRQVSGGMSVGEIVSVGVENNLAYVDYRITGTVAALGVWALALESSALQIPALTGQTWVGSWYWRLVNVVSGGPSSWQMSWDERDSSGTTSTLEVNNAVTAPTAASLASQRVLNTRTLAGGVNTACLLPRVRLTFGPGTHDFTIRLALPDFKIGAVPSSPVLPPTGTLSASTRGHDIATALLNALGISGNGACTVLWSGVIPVFSPGSVHTIACVDDASVNNRLTMRVDQASGQLQAMRALSGAVATANAGAVTAGIPFKAGMTANGAGRVAVSLNGGVAVNVTGGPSSGFTRFRLGNIADLSTPLWGETGRLRVLPYAVSDAEIAVLTGALP